MHATLRVVFGCILLSAFDWFSETNVMFSARDANHGSSLWRPRVMDNVYQEYEAVMEPPSIAHVH